jgi:hypothetical protein
VIDGALCKYDGAFNEKLMRDGNGTFTFGDGRYVVGMWSNDNMNGIMRFCASDDTLLYELVYSDGILQK